VPARATVRVASAHGRALVRKTRQRHHPFLQHIFGDALDDRDFADLIRIMERIDAQSRR
jgi:hypothetical protein